jgi:HTH-type transcriptional repressor of NAD biosynthesis genes
MKRSLVVGKFYPPHAGHSYLIEEAGSYAKDVTVMVADRPEHQIPGELRRGWLEEMHPRAHIRLFKDNLDDNDSTGWGKSTLKFLGFRPDYVLSSEDYGDQYAAEMAAVHIELDKRRMHVPCSATKVRRDPYAMWEYLAPPVRAYFALRICIVGAESTGKTTLAKSLAKLYKTEWVPEYGRLYTEQNIADVFHHHWTDKEFIHITKTQNQMEDDTARRCNKVLICDTDAFATSIWYERYFHKRSSAVEGLAAGRAYDLYIVTDPDTPHIQDGYRDGNEGIRRWMHQRFIEKMEFWGKDYLLVSGSPDERLKQSAQVIDKLLQTRHRLTGRQVDLDTV